MISTPFLVVLSQVQHFQRKPKELHFRSARSAANMSDNRKKYRKMRIKFDEAMRESNSLFLEEQVGNETVMRLMQENELVKFCVYSWEL